jgi:hypothetical protein
MRRIALVIVLTLAPRGGLAQPPDAPPPAEPPPGAESPAVTLLTAADSPLARRLFGEYGIDGGLPRFEGTRTPPVTYLPIFPQRVPPLNFADIPALGGLALRFGYRLGPPCGELICGVRYNSGEREVIFANGDPLLNRVANDPVVEALYRQPNNQGDAAPPDILPGVFDPAGAALVRSFVERTAVDFAYGNRVSLGPLDLMAAVGGRLGVFYEEDRSLGLGISSLASTHFVGGGPLIQGELRWWLTRPEPEHGGWNLYSRVGTSLLFGRARQSFREAVGDPYFPAFTEVRGEEGRFVPTFEVECGLGFRPFSDRTIIRIGYRFEQWWNVGGLDAERFHLGSHSITFRLSTPY